MSITTGSEDHSGTAAPVSLVVYGDKGHTDPLPLDTPLTEGPAFRPGANDEFKVNLGKDVGEVYKIRIGHDDPREEQGWFLDKVCGMEKRKVE